MSFILDALKKSEAERQRKGTPGIADVPQSSSNAGGNRWLWIIVALLAVNLAVLVVVILRPAADAVSPQELSPPKTSAENTVAASVKPFSDIVADAKRSKPPATIVPEPAPQTQSPQSPPDTEPAAPSSRQRVVDGPPSFEELRANGTLQLPDLHLDIHVFSATPAERFVFINMSKYRENSSLVEGPRIQEITPEGVVLEYLGTRFLLPRE
jgi:general secretion pathway protein B